MPKNVTGALLNIYIYISRAACVILGALPPPNPRTIATHSHLAVARSSLSIAINPQYNLTPGSAHSLPLRSRSAIANLVQAYDGVLGMRQTLRNVMPPSSAAARWRLCALGSPRLRYALRLDPNAYHSPSG